MPSIRASSGYLPELSGLRDRAISSDVAAGAIRRQGRLNLRELCSIGCSCGACATVSFLLSSEMR